MKYTPVWLIFYVIGMVSRDKEIKKHKLLSILFVIVTFVLEIGETLVLSRFDNFVTLAYSQMKISGILYSLCLIYLLKCFETKIKNDSLITRLGDESYGIYFVHIAFVLVANKLFSYFTVPFFLERLGTFMFALFSSLLVIFITKKIFKEKLSKTLFGF